MNRNHCLSFMFLLLFMMNLELLECKRGGGGNSRRVPTSSPRRTTTYRAAQRVTTPRYNVQTQQAYPNYNQPPNNRPGAAQKVTTPRYNIQTQSAYPNYNQPNYNRPGTYNNQPNYNQPNYNQPGYNQPNYNRPGSYNNQPYNQPGNNYYSPGGIYQNKKDHSVRNSVLAGLGGSALGLYLGYQIAGLTHGSNNNPNYVGGGGSGYPQYSVVHHYHHGDRPIPKEAKVEADVIKTCDNITFCTVNTTPLCMNNGTVYCVAALDSTIICNENSTELKCVNSTITLPCDANSTNCNGTAMNTTSISIPCVTTIDVFGDFTTNKLSVNKISKRSVEDESNTTVDAINSTNSDVNATTPTMTTLEASVPVALQSDSLTSQGISNKYCVTVIAEPVKEPEVLPNMSNEEYAKYLSTNEVAKEQAASKWSDISTNILRFFLI